jgi:hypothetical protein
MRSKAQPTPPGRTWHELVTKASIKSCVPRAIPTNIGKKRYLPGNPQSSVIGSVRGSSAPGEARTTKKINAGTCQDDGVS